MSADEPKASTPRQADDNMINMIVELASLKAVDSIKKSRWRFTRLLSGAAIIVVAAGGFLVDKWLNVEIGERVNKYIEENQGGLRSQVELISIKMEMELRLLDWKNNKGIPDKTLDLYYRDLGGLVNRHKNIPSGSLKESMRRDIVSLLERSIGVSAEADRNDFVNKFYNLAPDMLNNSDSVTQILVQHIGRRLIGEAGAPKTWFQKDGAHNDEYKQYKELTNRAHNTGYPEMFLAFELVMRHMEEKSDDEINGLIEDAEDLNERDKKQFVLLMVEHTTGGFSVNKDSSVRRVMERYKNFLEAYEKQSELIRNIWKSVFDAQRG